MTELETIWEFADRLMAGMQIPESRRRDHEWILRNAGINRADSPDLLSLEMCMHAVRILESERGPSNEQMQLMMDCLLGAQIPRI